MYRTVNMTQGEPPRLYRMPEDIRADMREISRRIKDTSSMLNVRNMLMEMLAESKQKPIKTLIMELEDMISGAKESLLELASMNETLTELRCELEDTKWAMGM